MNTTKITTKGTNQYTTKYATIRTPRKPEADWRQSTYLNLFWLPIVFTFILGLRLYLHGLL